MKRFLASQPDGPAVLEVRGDAAFNLVTKLKSPSGLVSNTNCVTKEQVHNVLGYDQTDLSYIRFINLEILHYLRFLGSLFDAENKVGQGDVKIIDSQRLSRTHGCPEIRSLMPSETRGMAPRLLK